MAETDVEKFDSWAILEIFGHKQLAGRVTEQAVGGGSYVRIDVPAVRDRLAYSRLYGHAAIYSITPCSEAAARAAAERFHDLPPFIYEPEIRPRLTAGVTERELAETDDDFDDGTWEDDDE